MVLVGVATVPSLLLQLMIFVTDIFLLGFGAEKYNALEFP